MDTPGSRSKPVDAGNSRFGDSRFPSSKLGGGQAGSWVDEGPRDALGRSSGWYRSGGEANTSVTGLTVVRPTVPAPPSTGKARAAPIEGEPTSAAINLPGGRHGVLLFHGLSSNPLELKFLARGLHKAGYTVRVAVLPGYSHGMVGKSPMDHHQWARGALAEFDRLRGSCDSLAVGGLCIGALLSLHVAAERGGAVSHVLALSTTMHYDGWAAPKSRWLLPLARVIRWVGHIPVKEREPYGLKDKRLRAWMAGQLKEAGDSHERASVKRINDLLEAQRLMKKVRQGLKKVTAPTLVVHARDDDMASPRSAFEVVSGVSSNRVHCVLLEDSYHLISIDQEKARVLEAMKEFLQSVGQTAEQHGSAPARAAKPQTTRSDEHVRA